MEYMVGISDNTRFDDLVVEWLQRHHCSDETCDVIVTIIYIDKDDGHLEFFCAEHGV